jgi:ketosteroid isomerase-like protein
MTAVLEVSARQFRDRQRAYFDLADKGAQIILRRGKKQSYILTSMEDDDLSLTPQLMERINHSMQQAKNGKITACNTYEDSLALLEAL